MEQKRRKCGASLRPSRAFGNRQAVPVGADNAEDRTAQFKFEGIGAVASRFRRNAEQRAAQCRIERRTEDLALRIRIFRLGADSVLTSWQSSFAGTSASTSLSTASPAKGMEMCKWLSKSVAVNSRWPFAARHRKFSSTGKVARFGTTRQSLSSADLS